MNESTREKIVDCLVEFTQRHERLVFQDNSWIKDWGLDSLRLFHSLLHIEKRLGFEFSDDELNLAKIEDFRNLVDLVDRRGSEDKLE